MYSSLLYYSWSFVLKECNRFSSGSGLLSAVCVELHFPLPEPCIHCQQIVSLAGVDDHLAPSHFIYRGQSVLPPWLQILLWQCCWSKAFPSFLHSPFLTWCAIPLTSFGGKRPNLRRWLVAQPLHQTVSLANDVTDATLGVSGVRLRTRTVATGSVTLARDITTMYWAK